MTMGSSPEALVLEDGGGGRVMRERNSSGVAGERESVDSYRKA